MSKFHIEGLYRWPMRALASLIRNIHILLFVVLVSTFIFYRFIGHRFNDPVAERKKLVESASEVHLGIVWPREAGDLFVEGALLAIDELNTEKGGLLNKKVIPHVRDETFDFDTALNVSRTLIQNPLMFAVVGHSDDSNASIAISLEYNLRGILMISPGTSSKQFVSHGFPRVFQTISDDYEVGALLVDVCKELGYKKVALINESTLHGRRVAYGESLSNAFIDAAGQQGIKVQLRRSFFPNEDNFVDIISQIKSSEAEAVILATLWPSAADFLKQAQTMELHLPMLGGDRLGTDALINAAGKAAEGLVIVSQDDASLATEKWKSFSDAFLKRWGVYPTSWSAKAYDAVSLLADTVQRSKSLNAEVLAALIRTTVKWEGVGEYYTFNQRGDVHGLKLYLEKVINGKFVPFPLTFTHKLPIVETHVESSEQREEHRLRRVSPDSSL